VARQPGLPPELRSISGKTLIAAFRHRGRWEEYSNPQGVIFGIRQADSEGYYSFVDPVQDTTIRLPASYIRAIANTSVGLEGLAQLVRDYRASKTARTRGTNSS
jgi:hypothetical protein